MDSPSGAFSMRFTLIVMGALWIAMATNVNTDCSQWLNNSVQNVSINSVTTIGSACRPVMYNISITLQCSAGARVLLNGINLQGGQLAIDGNISSVATGVEDVVLSNVSVEAHESSIIADRGPALGIAVRPPAPLAILNVSLMALSGILV